MNIPSDLKGKALWDFLAKHKKEIMKSKMERMKISDPTGTKNDKPRANEN